MVYYNGVWHFFYQFDDDPQHGSQVHWAHATSTDLMTWEEQPMAFYPDAHGAMYSGCAVADTTNTSGLFSSSKGGLVAIITCDGNGERIKVAYSEDEGKTWTKLDEIAVDCTEDPLKVNDFRDPKVFRWENKWFMVIAGGPLRIYSSDNLLDWTCESTYSTLHTECPDLYPVTASDGTVKWVLSRGGRLYKVGDFKQVAGKWTFVPDAAYADVDSNGIMNFGQDSYAAMTFYTQDFGTAAHPNIPEIIEINWMNTWNDGYCTRVASTISEQTGVKQEFNGTFNLLLKLGLEKQGNKYVLTQTPIEQYETLRDTKNAITLTGVEAAASNTLLNDFSGDCYEIDAAFTPGTDTTKVGFELRKGSDETTKVMYDLKTETMSIDRGKSGILVSDVFKTPDSQKVTRNADGTVDMRIYVDKASVEVFATGFTVAGAEQIFPKSSSQGVSVIVEGGPAHADITVYPMGGIWKKAAAPLSQSETNMQPEQGVRPVDALAISGNSTVTRAMLAQMLFQRENVSSNSPLQFPDVLSSDPYRNAIAWTAREGLMHGYTDGTFRPDTFVTHQQFAAVLYRYAEKRGCNMSTTDANISDKDGVSAWALPAVRWTIGENLLTVTNGLFSPAGSVTAAEVTQALTMLDGIVDR